MDVLLGWERERASEFSPGVVQDGEELCRYWLNPTHYDEATGTLKPTAVGDAEYLGLSTNRLGFTDLDQVRSAAAERAAARNRAHQDEAQRELIGYSRFAARDARDVRTNDGVRVFCIYDTAKREDPSHADVCQVTVKPKQAARSARAQLRNLMNQTFRTFN